jgi:signal transduction histidine kinase/CheY-like chemotaxis protein
MRIQRTSRIITVSVVVLSLLTIACAMVSLRYRTLQERNYAARRLASHMMMQLAGGSDRLTNAVRAYAVTGDRRYYDDFVRELKVDRTRDRAVEQLRQLELDPREIALLTRAKQNSDQLVSLEDRAFEAVKKGDNATAIGLVYGDEYQTAKASIMQPIAECRELLDTRLTDQAEQLAGRSRNAGYVGMAAIIANAAAVVGALLLFYGNRVVNPLAGLNHSLRELLEHKPGVQIAHQDADTEVGEVARSLESYRRAADEVEAQRWVKGQLAEVGRLLQKAETPEQLAQAVLTKLVPLVEAGCGAFYLFDEAAIRFRFIGGYGYQQHSGIERSYAPGEGIVGQCAQEMRTIELRNVPPEYIKIASGVGEAPPRLIVAAPVVSRHRALAVIEVALFGEMTAQQRALLEEVTAATALNLEVLQRNLKTRELLEHTQAQAEELQAGEAELRKRTEELQHTNFLSDSALDLTKAGYWHVPLDGSGWYNSSERAARIFGDPPTPDHRYTLDHWAAHVRAGDEAAAKVTAENFAAAVAGEIPVYDATYAYKRPVDDRVVWIHALGHVVKNADGKPTDMFGVTQDITDFKQLESDLRQAMQKAEEATKAKSAFLANMSHEIRTPMNGIMGMTELALDTELTAEQRDYLNTVKWSADALLTLINDILDFSKIEAGRIELDPVEFLLRDAIGDTLNPLALRASSKGLELAYDIAPGVPDALVADIYRLRQVIVNLVGNAIKFTETGEVVVSVRVAESQGEERVLEFSVRDTGIGISPAAAAKLFRPFEQADAATTRKYGGTGLGLAISRQLVELMGGEIRLHSEPQRGSTFSFTARVKVDTARSTASPTEAAQLLEGKIALIVDDNETNRRILETMLSHWGLRTLSADSGAKALALLDRSTNAGQAISIVITDLHMPEMDGFDLIAALRRHEAFNLLPVILLTSSASPGDQKRCEELHVAAKLLKPVKQSLLLDNIMRILAGDARDRAEAARTAPPPPLSVTHDAAATDRALRVLLAEDNPVNVKFALKLLERAGHQVTVAGNGRQAVDLWASEQPFDVILMDVQMPEMDGLEATRAIRQIEGERAGGGDGHIPVVAMTANAMAGDREMCLDAGMDGYVAKPVKRDALFAELDRVMAKGGEHAARV